MKRQSWQQWGKWTFIGASIAAIAMTAVFDDRGDKVEVAGKRPQQTAKHASLKQRPLDLPYLKFEHLLQPVPKQDGGRSEITNVFSPSSWFVPPPPPPPPKPVKASPPPKPTAPPLPFIYFGRYEDSSTKVIMLAKGEQIYTVSEGDVIDNTYRVEQVRVGVIDLTYLPLNIKQSINIGDPS
jgi:hypothetical protein